MVVSASLAPISQFLQEAVWLASVALHVVFLVSFLYHRAKNFEIHHMVPSWFVPQSVLSWQTFLFQVTRSLEPVAHATLVFGLLVYAVMLPLVDLPFDLLSWEKCLTQPKPTIAIMAAPASLSLTWAAPNGDGKSFASDHWVTFWHCSVDDVYYLHRVFKLLRLPFSPSCAALHSPIGWPPIGATALFKLAALDANCWCGNSLCGSSLQPSVSKLIVATFVVGYVAVRYYMNYKPHRVQCGRQ